MKIRPLDPALAEEVDRVARRMRATLQEVVDAERGAEMYSMAWLRDRVRQHLAGGELDGEVLLAEDADGALRGHVIRRVETEASGRRHGLFSTCYGEPTWRRRGLGTRLIRAGEAWMRTRGLERAVTYTAADNLPLIRSCEQQGYAVELRERGMVGLGKRLELGDG